MTEKPTSGWGPGTDGPVWSKERRRWVYPLNAHGRAVAESFLTKYKFKPELSIVNYHGSNCKGRWYGMTGKEMLHRCREFLGEEDTRSVAHDAVTRASAHYRPDSHGCSEDGFTYVVNGVYLALKRALDTAMTRANTQKEFTNDEGEDGEWDGGVLGRTEGHDSDPAEDAELTDWREVIQDLTRFLTERERRATVAHYRDGWTLSEIGRGIGVKRERVRQILMESIRKLKAAATRRGLTRNTPGEGPNLPPSRRVRCIPRNRSAAIR